MSVINLLNPFSKKIEVSPYVEIVDLNSDQAEYEEDLEQLVTSGYKGNPVVYACTEKVSRPVSMIPFHVYTSPYIEDREVDKKNHIEKNLFASGEFSLMLKELATDLIIFGNAYLDMIPVNKGKVLGGIKRHSPLAVKAVLNSDKTRHTGYALNGKENPAWSVDARGHSQLLHLKLGSLANEIYGTSSLIPAKQMINLYNEYARANLSTLQNGGNPSGVVIMDPNSVPDTLTKVKKALASAAGTLRRGGYIIISGVEKFIDTKRSEEINYKEGFATAARVIALAIGVPPMLISIEGDNTYSNMKLGTEELWDATVLYMAQYIRNMINRHNRASGVEGIYVDYDLSKTPINQKLRKYEDDMIRAVPMSINEKRALKDLPPIDESEIHEPNKNNDNDNSNDSTPNQKGNNGGTK
jgi:HK97 family phage portal protein